MADLSITAANVVAGSNASVTKGTAGATVTAGQVVYKEASSGKYKLADADSGTEEVRQPDGIALNGAADGQPLSVLTGGDITIGATVTAGDAYYLSPTAGGIAPLADVLTGDDIVLIGLASSTSVIRVMIFATGATAA